MATLTLEKVGKTYGSVRAVGDVSLDVGDGEIIGLLGSSGCGKTSTLRMIAGFERISEGTIRIGGRVVNAVPVAQRNVAMAFEGYSLYPPLTIGESPAGDRGYPRSLSLDDLRRTAAAHQPRPRARPAGRGLSAGRADVPARAPAARRAARSDQGLAPAAQDDDGIRHP
jgi:ABC-type thiamine transport system ATPase subunit